MKQFQLRSVKIAWVWLHVNDPDIQHKSILLLEEKTKIDFHLIGCELIALTSKECHAS